MCIKKRKYFSIFVKYRSEIVPGKLVYSWIFQKVEIIYINIHESI